MRSILSINDDFPLFANWFEICGHCLATVFFVRKSYSILEKVVLFHYGLQQLLLFYLSPYNTSKIEYAV